MSHNQSCVICFRVLMRQFRVHDATISYWISLTLYDGQESIRWGTRIAIIEKISLNTFEEKCSMNEDHNYAVRDHQ